MKLIAQRSLAAILVMYFAANLLLQLFLPKFLLANLSVSLPFREAYYPTVAGIALAYLAPIAAGYLLGLAFASYRIKRPSVYYINLALAFGLVNTVGILLRSYGLATYWFNAEVVSYYTLLYPVLLLVGMLPFHLTNHDADESPQPVTAPRPRVRKLAKGDYGIAVLIGGSLFVLNLLPMMLSHYLVGADVYYHAAKTQSILNGDNLLASPFFAGEKNYYYSIVYYILTFIGRATHASVVTVWFLYIPACSFLFGLAFYLFVVKLKQSRLIAILATLFVAVSNQVVWADPSDRGLAYALLALTALAAAAAIQQTSGRALVMLSVLWLLSLATHPEFAVHLIGITAIFMCLSLPAVRRGALSRRLRAHRGPW